MTTSDKQKQYTAKYRSNPENRKKDALKSTANTKLWYKIPGNREKSLKIARNYQIRLKQNDPIKYMLMKAKSRAKISGIPFNLVREDLATPEYCPVLGYKLDYTSLAIGKRAARIPANSASLDRIIPSLGYVKGNAIIISFEANRLKNNATVDQLKRLYEFYSNLEITNVNRA